MARRPATARLLAAAVLTVAGAVALPPTAVAAAASISVRLDVGVDGQLIVGQDAFIDGTALSVPGVARARAELWDGRRWVPGRPAAVSRTGSYSVRVVPLTRGVGQLRARVVAVDRTSRVLLRSRTIRADVYQWYDARPPWDAAAAGRATSLDLAVADGLLHRRRYSFADTSSCAGARVDGFAPGSGELGAVGTYALRLGSGPRAGRVLLEGLVENEPPLPDPYSVRGYALPPLGGFRGERLDVDLEAGPRPLTVAASLRLLCLREPARGTAGDTLLAE